MDYTDNYQFYLPSLNDSADISALNENFSKIDEKLKENENAISNVKVPTDQTYKPTSENPQSGKAVAEALAQVKIDVDDTITADGENPVSGGAVAIYVDGVKGELEEDIAVVESSVSAIATVEIEKLFYPENIIEKAYINPTTGIVETKGTELEWASDLMPLQLDTDYAISRSVNGTTYLKSYLFLYDVNGGFVARLSLQSNTFNISSASYPNVTQFRVMGSNKDLVNEIMIVYGTELPTEYTPYAKQEVHLNDAIAESIANNPVFDEKINEKIDSKTDYIGAEQLKDGSVSPNKTNFMSGEGGVVLYDPDECELNKYINVGTGELGNTTGDFASDFMPLELNTDYAISYSLLTTKYVFLYDENKEWIGRVALSGETFKITESTLTTSTNISCENARYFRISGKQNDGAYKNIMIVYGQFLPDEYTPYAKFDLELSKGFNDAISNIFNRWIDKKVSCLGDSITYGYGTTVKWADLIWKYLHLSSVTTEAVVGSSIAKKDESATTSFVERVKSLPVDADLYIVLGGINDWRSGNIPIGEQSSTNTAEFYGALNYIVEQIYTLNSNAEIVLMTPIHSYDSDVAKGSIDTDNKIGLKQKDFRDAIINVGARHSVPVIDLYALSGINNFTKSVYMTSDNLHPNTAGHEKMAEVIARELKKL